MRLSKIRAGPSARSSPVPALWHQRWSLGGIPLAVGRPEYVGTLPDYRNRGLVRALFEMLHARSAARGDHLQIIFGIPHYYRQFGYEFAADIYGERAVYIALIPQAEEGAAEPYHLRPATVGDVPHLKALYDQGRSASLAWAEVSEAEWRYYVTSWDEPHLRSLEAGAPGLTRRLYMVVDGSSGSVCGFVCVASSRRDHKLDVHLLAAVSQRKLAGCHAEPAAQPAHHSRADTDGQGGHAAAARDKACPGAIAPGIRRW